MQKGFILTAQDIKKIIAAYYNVSEEKVVSTKYTFFVITDDEEKTEK